MRRRALLTIPLAVTLAAATGCSLFTKDPAGATIQVSAMNYSVAGSQGGTIYTLRGTELEVLTKPRQGSTTPTSTTKQISTDQRAEAERLTRKVLAEPKERGMCSDSPITSVRVHWPNGPTEDRSVTHCGGTPAGSAIIELATYVARL